LAPESTSAAHGWQRVALADADVRLTQFCDAAQAQQWFARLHAEIPWQQQRIRLFGRDVAMPRLSCWIGDADAAYRYSRVRFEPRPWTPALSELRDVLQTLCGQRYNSVLCNLYRDGNDAMGWHSDNEPELGAQPSIASLSFGAPRRFRLRQRRDKRQRIELELAPGSLLLMAGATQQNYQHDLPRMAHAPESRINLTFRRIFVPRSGEQHARDSR
jgi:alkylated DNA repair dioxygenase AlkB